MSGARWRREPKGYGMLGVSWASSPFGWTLLLCFGKRTLLLHRRDREMEALVRAEADRLAAGVSGAD